MNGASQPPHGRTSEDVILALGVSATDGLSAGEVRKRRRRYGRNRLRQVKERSAWRILADQFESVIVWLLAGAVGLSFWLGQWAEGTAILVVLAINAAIGFTTELKATRSMESLRRFSRVVTKVRRGGQTLEVPAQDLVPGDVVLLEGGDVVTADLRLIEGANLQCDESALTGESVPVPKGTPPVAADTPLAERSSMAFKGTAVTRGSGAGVVVATGMATELGRISALAEAAEGETSPLEKRLDRLGAQLVWATLALAGAIGAAGVYVGKDPVAMIETAIALAVAAVPEGLPIVATVVLARGMWRMARRNALIQRLSAVETLGATTIILTDKTGTLTENRMTVTRILLAAGLIEVAAQSGEFAFTHDGKPLNRRTKSLLDLALRSAVLCNNAALAKEDALAGVGDPMELALLVAGAKGGIERRDLLAQWPETREEAFTSDTNMMATFHRAGDGCLVAVKGAPEAVIERAERVMTLDGPTALTPAAREQWARRNDELAEGGLRVLALATKDAASKEESPYTDLTLLGLVGLLDPPRQDVAGAIRACRQAGLRVVMVTGDHVATARRIALEVGLAADPTAAAIEARDLADLDRLPAADRERLLSATVFARISPKTKLDLVALYQASGAVVAMTGDGVNDAPALKKADIGIAMGQRGTQVAREAADMVLRDDAFTSIVAAMEQGRIVFGNIRNFVTYLMSCNFSEIITIGLATVSGLPLPLLPLQILFLNLVTDVFPAFALGAGEGDAGIMRRPPRDPKEAIIDPRTWGAIAAYGLLITAATLGAFVVALFWLKLPESAAITVSFLTLAFAQLLHVFNMRAPRSGSIRNEVTRNPLVWGAVIFCTVLILAAIYLPGLSSILGLVALGGDGWSLVAGASLMPLIVGQLAKHWSRTGPP